MTVQEVINILIQLSPDDEVKIQNLAIVEDGACPMFDLENIDVVPLEGRSSIVLLEFTDVEFIDHTFEEELDEEDLL